MLRKDINFTTFDGQPAQKTVYFNLTKTELVKLMALENGTFIERIQNLNPQEQPQEVMDCFYTILERSYGVRNGDRFMKSPELFKEFEETAAFDAFFMELVTDANAGANFVNGLMPADLINQINSQMPTAAQAPVQQPNTSAFGQAAEPQSTQAPQPFIPQGPSVVESVQPAQVSQPDNIMTRAQFQAQQQAFNQQQNLQ